MICSLSHNNGGYFPPPPSHRLPYLLHQLRAQQFHRRSADLNLGLRKLLRPTLQPHRPPLAPALRPLPPLRFSCVGLPDWLFQRRKSALQPNSSNRRRREAPIRALPSVRCRDDFGRRRLQLPSDAEPPRLFAVLQSPESPLGSVPGTEVSPAEPTRELHAPGVLVGEFSEALHDRIGRGS